MSTPRTAPTRLASEEVIISAPMSYAGSAQRIVRIRRRAPEGWQLGAVTALTILLIVLVWALVTVWYLTWGILLVPYRVLRRGARKRRVEALRHRELLGTIQGSAAASASSIVTATIGAQTGVAFAGAAAIKPPGELVSDADRDVTVAELREHLLTGRLTPEEFGDRVGAAHRARTRGDLDGVTANLPPGA